MKVYEYLQVYEWLVVLDLETALQQFQNVLGADSLHFVQIERVAFALAFFRVLLAPELFHSKRVGREKPFQLNYLSKEARGKKEIQLF